MIGFFDSGFGGLTVLREVIKELPGYSYIYLGDNLRAPYGSLGENVIYKYTCEGIEELFKRGADLIVLACNTSSAVALRKIQQEHLPKYHPDKRVLGIIIPTAEEMIGMKNIGIFATEATVKSDVYRTEILKINADACISQLACPLLVPIIESGNFEQLDDVVKEYVKVLFLKDENIETMILGCTHYAIIEDYFRKYVPQHVKIVSQGKIVAEKLKKYLSNHSEIECGIEKGAERIFLTTESSSHVHDLAQMFYGSNISMNLCVIISSNKI